MQEQSQKGNQMNLINVINEEKMQENIAADNETRIALEEELLRRKGKMMNSQLKEELLRISEYLEEYLKTETSSDTKRSYGVKFDNLHMFAGGTFEEGQFADIVIKEEGDMQNLNSIMKEDWIARSRINVNTQLGRSVSFQHILRGKSKGSLAYDDGKKKQEVEKDIKQPSGGLKEEKYIKEEGLNSHKRISEWETELELLQKWLKAPVEKKEPNKYYKEITEEEVHYCEPEQGDILGTDDVEERITNSLMNSFENSNQQTDMLIEDEKIKQHTDVFPKEQEELRPYVFYFNN